MSKQNRKRRKRIRIRPIWKRTAAGLVIIAVLFLAGLFFIHKGPAFAEGKTYLENQTKLDLNKIQTRLAKIRQQQLGEAIQSGEADIFAAFGDSVLMGDSRVYGFDAFGFLPSSQVLAGAGYSILNITDFLDQLKTMQPQYIYLSYGVNDMGLDIGADLGENGPGYAKVYKEQLEKVREVCPNAKLVINSIIPCTPEALQRAPQWGRTDSFNEAIKAMCKENNWIYVDNDSLADGGNAPIYSPGGVHFVPEFYPGWAENMIKASMWDLLK